MKSRALTLLTALALPIAAFAHGSESHGVESAALAVLHDDITLPKSLQRAFAITTVQATSLAQPQSRQLTGEVVPHPIASTLLLAAQPGRLHPAEDSWPVIGQAVAANQLLAVIEPQMSLREQGQRRAELAQLEKRLYMSNINTERLRLQSEASQGVAQTGNVWLAQAEAETRGYGRQIELMKQSLAGRVEIRAPQAGYIQNVPVARGEIVALGQPLFALRTRSPVRFAVRVYDPAFANRLAHAQVRIGDATALPVVAAGITSAAPEPGWTLWLDTAEAPADPPAVGLPVAVELQIAGASAVASQLRLPRACVLGLPSAPYVWVHESAERFERRSLQVAGVDGDFVTVTVNAGLDADDRIVADGAALLSQYR